MLELFQHEDSQDCGRVRRKLSELMIDFIARQVPRDTALCTRLQLATGQSDIPVLIDPEQRMIITEADDIIAYLEETYGARQTVP